MNPYLIFFTFTIGIIFSYYANDSKKRNLYFIFSLILSLLVAIRSESTPDTSNYLNFYRSIECGNLVSLSQFSFEPGFQLYTHFLKLISFGNTSIYLFYISITNTLILWKTFNNIDNNQTNNPTLFLILYYSFFGLFYNAIVIRAGIAISLVLFTISLQDSTKLNHLKKRTVTLCVLIIAVLFHYSAILSIPIYIIYRYTPKLSKGTYILLWIIPTTLFAAKISSFIIPNLINIVLNIFDTLSNTNLNKYSYYITELYDLNSKLPYRLIFQFAACLLFISVNNATKQYYKFLNIYLCGLFLSSIFYSIEQLSRITDYFLIFSFILFYMIYERYLLNKYIIIPFISTIYLQLIFVIRIIKDH